MRARQNWWLTTTTGADCAVSDSESTRPTDAAPPSSENQLPETNSAVAGSSSLPQMTVPALSNSIAANTSFDCSTCLANGYETVDELDRGERRFNLATVSGALIAGGRSKPTFAIW